MYRALIFYGESGKSVSNISSNSFFIICFERFLITVKKILMKTRTLRLPFLPHPASGLHVSNNRVANLPIFQHVSAFHSLRSGLLFGLARKLGAWRLFSFLPHDYYRKVDTMSKPKLTMKIAGYGVKAKVIFDLPATDNSTD